MWNDLSRDASSIFIRFFLKRINITRWLREIIRTKKIEKKYLAETQKKRDERSRFCFTVRHTDELDTIIEKIYSDTESAQTLNENININENILIANYNQRKKPKIILEISRENSVRILLCIVL